jgi:hypothetical protein
MLSSEDLSLINRRRGDPNRLGFALMLCYLRFPGRILQQGEQPPAALCAFVAEQLGLDAAHFGDYAERDQTRREHVLEIETAPGLRPLTRVLYRELAAWLLPTALTTEGGHDAERRLPIEPSDADPGAPTLISRCRSPSQSDRHQCKRNDDRDYAERPEACRVGCRKKELSDNSGQQTRLGVDAQDLSPGFFRRGAVEPTLNDNEQPGKTEPGEGASQHPC